MKLSKTSWIYKIAAMSDDDQRFLYKRESISFCTLAGMTFVNALKAVLGAAVIIVLVCAFVFAVYNMLQGLLLIVVSIAKFLSSGTFIMDAAGKAGALILGMIAGSTVIAWAIVYLGRAISYLADRCPISVDIVEKTDAS